jgi:putative transposase
MPFVKVYIHFVRSTKNKVQTLNRSELSPALNCGYRENSKKKDLFIDFVNRHAEHCHCLVSLGGHQTNSKVMQLINGESAFWFDKRGLKKKLNGRMNILQFQYPNLK